MNTGLEAAKPTSGFTLEKCLDISKIGGCRIVETCDLLGMILVSQKSNCGIFNGYGFRKVNSANILKFLII